MGAGGEGPWFSPVLRPAQAIPVQCGHGPPLVCMRLLLPLTAAGTQTNLTTLRSREGLPPTGPAVCRTRPAGVSQGHLPVMAITPVPRTLIKIPFGVGIISIYSCSINKMSLILPTTL